MTDNKRFTICIPTYNRGERALALVEQILPKMREDWEILVLDNCSGDQVEAYQKIRDLSKKNNLLKYVRREINYGFHGNYIGSFEYASTPFIMIMSDEDFPNMEELKLHLDELIDSDKVGIVRGSIAPINPEARANSQQHGDYCFSAGEKALMAYSLINNYLSGTIYNREKIVQSNILDTLKFHLGRAAAYPHLFLEALVCTKLDVKVSSHVLSLEGLACKTEDENGNSLANTNEYKAPYTYGDRMDQFIVLRDVLYIAVENLSKDSNFNVNLFLSLYLRLIDKYFHLITKANGPMYTANLIDVKILQESFYYFASASIVRYPIVKDHLEKLIDEITKVYKKWIVVKV